MEDPHPQAADASTAELARREGQNLGVPKVDHTHVTQLEDRASKVARELHSLSLRVRQDVGAVEELLIVLDVVVLTANTLLDEQDRRHWAEKVEAVLNTCSDVGEDYGPRIADFLLGLDEGGIERLAKKYARRDYLDHVRRMIGEAAFYRLHVAVSQDCDVVIAAAHTMLEGLMPYAVALSDMAEVLTEQQISEFMDFNPAGGFLLEMTLKLFEVLDVAVEKVALPEHVTVISRARTESPTSGDLLGLTKELRTQVSGRSRALVKDVSLVLDRKLQGAKDALSHSADSVSQAANSLIEFIDRLLRSAYTEVEVLAWLESNYTDTPDLTYVHGQSGRNLPTKRGQALCLVHACQPAAEPSPIHLLAATSVSVTRRRLQALKHGDLGTPAEQDQIASCMIGIEAFVQIGCRMAWAWLEDAALAELKSRLDPAAGGEGPVESREIA